MSLRGLPQLMPRGSYVPLVKRGSDPNDALELLLRYHIQAVRKRKNGLITQVKHIQFGWMSVETYYQLQKLHDALPLIQTFVEGGYRLKAAIWSYTMSFEALASGVSIPISVVLIIVAGVLAAIDYASGDHLLALLDVLALGLPYGELYLLWRGADLVLNFLSGTAVPAIQTFIGNATQIPNVAVEEIYNFLKTIGFPVALIPGSPAQQQLTGQATGSVQPLKYIPATFTPGTTPGSGQYSCPPGRHLVILSGGQAGPLTYCQLDGT